MSATRLIVRLFLVAVLVSLGLLIFIAWRNSDPNQAVARAEADVKNEEYESAVLRLKSHLEKKPENAEAHRLLAATMLKAAEQENAKQTEPTDQGETYFSNPEAFAHLMTAANLLPEDIELQKEVLAIFLRGNKARDGVDYAERILKAEPDNANALYSQAVAMVGRNNKKSPEAIEKLLGMDSGRKFQTYALALAYYDRNKKEEEVQATFDASVEAAAALTGEQVNTMPRLESDAMSRILKASVARAPDASAALARTKVAFDTLDKFPLETPAVLADVTQIDSELLLGLRERFKPTADTAEQKSLREALQARVDSLRDRSLEAKVASPLVFQQSAAADFAAGNHEEAAETLKKALAEAAAKPPARPEDVLELHLLAARNYVVMRKHNEAQTHIAELLKSKNDSYAGWGSLLSGGVASAEGRYQKAYVDFQDAQKKLGANLFVSMGLANTSLSLGKWKEALPHLKALHRTFDSADVEVRDWAQLNNISGANVHFGEFRAHLALDDWKSAQESLSKLTGTSLAPQAQAMAIMYLWGKADKKEALTRLEAARAQAPDNLMLLQLEAGIKQASGQVEDAGKMLADAAKANPGDLKRQLMYARWLIQQKKMDEALELVTKVAADFPKETSPQLLQAQVHLMKGDIAESKAIAEKLKENPDAKAAASFLLAAADMREKDPEAAAKELKAMAAESPNNGLINLLQGEVATTQGDFGGAFDFASESIDVMPVRAQARSMLLRSLLLLAAEKGPEAAEAKLQPLVAEHPKDEFLKIALADLKFKQGQFDTAMQLLTEAEQLDPGRGNVPYIKASIWLQRGRIPTAYTETEKALSIQPDHVPARLMAANLATAQGKHREAYDHASHILKQAPKYAPMILTQAAAMVGMGQKPQALQFLQEAIKENPKVDVYYDRVMSLQFDGGEKDAALASIRQGRKEVPDSLLLAGDEIALLVNMDKVDDAQNVAKAFTKDVTDPARFLAVAQAFFRGRKFDEARDWGGQALALAKDEVKPAVHLFLGDVNLVEYETSAVKDKEILTKARDHFQAVIAAQPKNFVAGNNLAWILANDFDDAEQAAAVIDAVRGKATVEQMPVNFIDTVAVVYRKANRLKEAQQVLVRANEMYQDNPLLLYQLAVVQHDLKLYTAARSSLERALQLGVPEKYKAEAARLLNSARSQGSGETPTSTSTDDKP